MNRETRVFFTALMMSAGAVALASAPANAQSGPSQTGSIGRHGSERPVAYDQLPAGTLSQEERDAREQEALRQRYWRERREAEAGTPPASAVPGAAPAPGAQLPQPAFAAPQGQPSDPSTPRPPGAVGVAPPGASATSATVAALPPEDQPETGTPKELPPNLQRQMVDFQSKEAPGTLIVDTDNTYLYLVLGNGKAMRYGIGVGREGFTWAGTERVSRMAEWPDWHPPAEMIERQPYLPRFMAGGDGNPLGARALYLGKTLYRIHGTNQPSTIGSYVSSGCIRLLNKDIEDLYSRVQVGTRVVVWPSKKPAAPPPTNIAAPNTAQAQLPPAPAAPAPAANAAPVPGQRAPGSAAPPLGAPTTVR
ncbi:L,D-transpeptidase family protein [Pseudolabrys sp.]|uniref:L,D-transpeptidase n=1 Tax=Pseudolabrys sp. TaxID=1960880 RepID=UPI003D146861